MKWAEDQGSCTNQDTLAPKHQHRALVYKKAWKPVLAAAFPNYAPSSPTLFLPLLFLVSLPSFFFALLLVPLPLSQPPGRAQNGSPTSGEDHPCLHK